MKTWISLSLLVLALAICAAEPRKIPLSNVEGRIDHLSIDLKTKHLFIAALGNSSVEVVDLEKAAVIQSIKGLEEPQGLVFVPDVNKVFVACGGDGSVRVYDGTTLKEEKKIDLKSDADGVRYDATTKRVYVGHESGAIAVIDPATCEILADIKVSGHPEAFSLDAAAQRVYVNVPGSGSVEVIDLEKKKVIEKWKLKSAKSNFPMALDSEHHRLFVGCRSPACIEVLDTQSGKELATLESVGDMDDLFWDAGKLIAIGGEGKVLEYAEQAGQFAVSATTKTRKGARTGLWVSATGQLFIAARKEGENPAEVWELKAEK